MTLSREDPLFGTRWVHVFEEDTPAGAVYRPEDDPIQTLIVRSQDGRIEARIVDRSPERLVVQVRRGGPAS